MSAIQSELKLDVDLLTLQLQVPEGVALLKKKNCHVW